jgi:hypothetical protein
VYYVINRMKDMVKRDGGKPYASLLRTCTDAGKLPGIKLPHPYTATH